MHVSESTLYTIGEVGRLCNISTKALRYYDKIGLITPDHISLENGYRYYNRHTLLTVPVLKYYKQMGFKLEEMQNLIRGSSYSKITNDFRLKIEELKIKEQEIHLSYIAVRDWHSLVEEAELVVQNNLCEVGVKFVPPLICCYMEQEFDYNYIESIINISWTNYLEKIQEKITGPVILQFDSFEEKRSKTCRHMKIMQAFVQPSEYEQTQKCFGGFMAATAYHIGPLENMEETYDKIKAWTFQHGYTCGPESYERYVIDYWTTPNKDAFVTEVLVPISRTENIPLKGNL